MIRLLSETSLENNPLIESGEVETEIYQLFADCLSSFRHKISILMKTNNCDEKTLNKMEQQNLYRQTTKNCKQLYLKYQKLEKSIQSRNQSIFIRFLSRIKQTVHEFILKTHKSTLGLQLKKIQDQLKNSSRNLINDRQLMYNLLIKTPSHNDKLNYCEIQRRISSKEVIPSNVQKNNKKQINDSIQTLQDYSNQISNNKILGESYDQCLQRLDSEYKLLDCLGINETVYRRIFFIGQRDMARNQKTLFLQALQRNEYIKWMVLRYSGLFEKYKIRRQKQKTKIKIKPDIQIIDDNNLCKVSNTLNEVFKSSQRSNSANDEEQILILNKVSSSKTQISQKKTNYPLFQQTYGNKAMYKLKKKNFPNVDKYDHQKIELIDKMSTEDIEPNQSLFVNARLLVAEKQRIPTNLQMNVFPLKKVEFKNKRLELGPQQNHSIISRKKNLIQRVHEKQQKMSILQNTFHSSKEELANFHSVKNLGQLNKKSRLLAGYNSNKQLKPKKERGGSKFRLVRQISSQDRKNSIDHSIGKESTNNNNKWRKFNQEHKSKSGYKSKFYSTNKKCYSQNNQNVSTKYRCLIIDYSKVSF